MTTLILTVTLIGVALMTMCLAPRALPRGRWALRHPAASLATWLLAVTLGVGAIVAAVVVGVVGTLTTTEAEGVPVAIIASVVGWTALALVGGAAMVIAAGRDTVAGAAQHNREALFALPCSIRAIGRRTDLRVCDTPEIFAFSVAGHRGTVAVSTGLVACTTPAQLRAIVAHERAHLALRHDIVTRLIDLDISCLPRSRAALRLRSSSRLLIELIADDRAARTAGAVHLANALLTIGTATSEPTMELRAERLAQRRWRPATRLAPVSAPYPAIVATVAERRSDTAPAR